MRTEYRENVTHSHLQPLASSLRPLVYSLKLRFVLAGILCFAGCGALPEGGPGESFGVDFTPPAGVGRKAVRGAIVFVVDGVNGHIFQQMLEKGELPAMRKYFADRGLYVQRAIANTPSVTLANITSLATGRFPGHHDITGVRWFDRRGCIWRDYTTIAQKNTLDGDYRAGNIFEQFPGEMTVSIFYQPHRGTTKFFENWMSAGPAFFFGMYEYIDRLTLLRFGEMMDIARRRSQFPVVTYAYLLAPDFNAYAHGVSSRQYRQAIQHTDKQIGRLLGDLERAGLLNQMIIAFVSDHSLGDVKHHFALEKFLREKVQLGVAPGRLWEETPEKNRLKYYARYPAAMAVSGDRYAALSLRKPIRRKNLHDDEKHMACKQAMPPKTAPASPSKALPGTRVTGYKPWPVRPAPADLHNYPVGKTNIAAGKSNPAAGKYIDLPKMLIGQPAVEAVAWATGPNRCRVRTTRGEVEFAQPAGQGGRITAKFTGENFLLKRPGSKGKAISMTQRQWLTATADSDYPDLPAQILAYFRSPRAGDIAVFATPGWDFCNSNKAGHGGLRAYDDMVVPLLIAGPGIPHETRKIARTADLVPTLLTLLGKTPPTNLDGHSLISKP
ncbi:MAG: alkaline phosphatase family protein [Phycisphaerae bacterium]|nr:alkaline phosphatase family protein [Phycisphaerae bacterium]